MKFGKYLAARQLELPEYAGHFINYKGLKKLINALIANNNVSENNNNNNNNNSNNNFNSDNNGLLKDKKGSFFFRLERELEKVNEFYLEKEAELKFRLDILIEKKNKALKNGRLNNITKNSIAFVSLYDGFKKFSQDLDRLEQFVELNETGFTKVLKKWDKRSKSRTKELYLTTAVNVQPVFHRDEIIELSDLVANHLMELEAKVEGNVVIRYDSNSKNNTNNNKSSDINDQFDENMMDGNISRKNSASTITNEGVIIPKLSYSTTSVTSISSSAPISNQNYLDNRHNQQQQQQFQQQQFQQQQQQQQQHEKSSNDDTEESSPINDDRDSDELYTDFYDITTQNANLSTEEQDSILKEWSNQILSKLSNNSKKFTLSKVFMLLIPNIHVPDESLEHFYELFKDYIDLNIIDDLSGRNCLLEASAAKTGRNFVINLCLNNYKDNNKKFITKKDISGRNCLHYITENGRNDLLTLLLENKFIDSETKNFLLNSTDNVSISPLLLAIVHNHLTSIEILLKNGANGFPLQDDLKPTYLPLNIACKFGNDKVVKLLLQQFGSPDLAKEKKLLTHSFQTNAEGLLPLHIVASSGHDNLIPLLLEYGADINQKDKLNKWSPIFYSVTRGFASTTEKLINYGAHFDIQDEDDFTPLYYAIWEGEVDVLNILMNSIKKQKKLERAKLKLIKRNNYLDGDLEPPKAPHLKISNPDLPPSFDNLNFNTNDLTNYNANNNDNNKVDDFALDDSKQLANDFNNVEMIPDLSLPPPIIPLRKYGHNFLEKKIFLKLTFYTNRNSISLNPDTFLTSIPGRITISCVKNDLIPRNLLLPVLDLDKSITFQTDSFDGFAVDFELFPTFGTRLIAKATLPSSLFSSSFPGVGSKTGGDLEIPLFDVRLRTIGSLKFNYEIIYPYCGIPLEISMYDTYWKSTNNKNNNDNNNNNNNDDNNSIITTATNNRTTTYVSFVTASSVSGEYFTVHICLLSDGTPIVCPSWQVHIGNNVYLPVTSFTMETLKSILIKQNDVNYDYLSNELKNIKDLSKDSKKLEKILSILYIPLSQFLKLLPIQISLNLEIFFPSLYEFEFCNLNYSINSFNLTNKCKNEKEMNTLTDSILNNFTDLILFDVFNHVRELRSSNSIANRHLILSSDNSSVCTILNWKQPNYPVFYNINGIKYDSKSNKFNKRTANGFNIENKEYHQLLLKNYPNNKYNSMTSNTSKYSSNNNNNNNNNNNSNNNNNNNSSSNDSNSKIDDNGDDHEDEDNYDISNEFSVNIENIDSINKHSSAYTNELMNQDRLTRSVKLAINFASTNNLLGIIIPNKLLHICPELVRSIRSKGLILVASGGGSNSNIQPMNLHKSSSSSQSKQSSGFENEEKPADADDDMNDDQDDDVDDDDDDEDEVDSDDKSHMEVDWGMGVNDVNGLRFNDTLTFKDAIDM